MSGAVTASLVGRAAGDRSGRARAAGLILFAILIVVAFLALATGPTGFIPERAFAALRWALFGDVAVERRDLVVVLEIRLPRVLLGLLVGAALAVSGVMLQGLFRNPLADPGLVGVASGAALAAVTVIVLGGDLLARLPASLALYTLPLAAFLGGLGTTMLLYGVATRRGHTSVATMLLAGIALAALAGAATGILVFMSDDQQLRDFTFWSLGSLAGATWDKVLVAALFVAAVLAAMPFVADGLDAFLLGEAAAGLLGIETQRLKRLAIFAVAAAVGAAVAVAGPIGFVGLVIPHLVRLAIGPRHRALLPNAALAGAILLLLADMIARTIAAPAELPIGIVTAFLGAPFFLWLLLRRRMVLDL